MKSVAIFCGSSLGNDPIYEEKTRQLGQYLAKKKITVVYGGANVGLMKVIADGTLKGKGKVYGVLPKFLKSRELAHPELTEMYFVDTMHERKMKMNDLSEGVIALPGGFGTLEEFFEMLTWAQLGLHTKPIAIFNINGYYDSLLELFGSMTEKKFLRQMNYNMVIVSSEVEDLIFQMKNYKPEKVSKWISPKEV